MITFDDISQRIPANLELNEKSYTVWLDHNWERLDDLRRANPGEENVKCNAIELFISFQAFHVYFKYKGFDRMQLNEDYELWRDVLRPFFNEDQCYGELEYIHDQDHADMIVGRIMLLDKELEPLVAASTGEHLSVWEEIDDWTRRADEAIAKST